MPSVVYNEVSPYPAQWLRNLIEAGHIAPGIVDERSIEDLDPTELIRATQFHTFAGIGVWSYALRLAGWPDDRPVWTGSCPCQPFSCAGKGDGIQDERHLWPAFRRLIATCLPPTIFGEQVASKDGRLWLSNVRRDLENILYWRQFYQDLHMLQNGEAENGLPVLFGQVCRRAETNLQGMPAGEGIGVEEKEQGETESQQTIAQGGRSGLQENLRCTEPGETFDCGVSPTLEKERPSVRLGRTSCGDRDQNAGRSMRNDWSGPQLPFNWETGMGQPVDRQDRPEKRLHLRKHQDRMLADERSNGLMGRNRSCGNAETLAIESINEKNRRLAVSFERFLAAPSSWEGFRDIHHRMEMAGYAVGAADLCAAGIGAPHIRQRLYWVADAQVPEFKGTEPKKGRPLGYGQPGGMGDADSAGPFKGNEPAAPAGYRGSSVPAGWTPCTWLPCRDGKSRPVEPGSFPLVAGLPRSLGHMRSVERERAEMAGLDGKTLKEAKANRIARLRGYGNGLTAQVAAIFIRSYLESTV